jgi:phage N-6-adenine-methyltransferase
MTSTTSNVAALVVDAELAALVPPLQAEERRLLEESLAREGCRDPLVVWAETGILLDGHNRHAICTRLGIPFTTTTLSFATKDEALLWVVDNQLGRRNLSDLDRIALAAKREPLQRLRAAANQGARTDLVQNSAGGSERSRTRELAARTANVSHDTYTKGKKVLEQGVPELVQAVRAEEVSIDAASLVADLPVEEQVEVVATGKVKEVAKSLRENRRQKNSGNNEWGSPRAVLDSVRQVLGTIDLDPATHDSAQRRVQATKYYTKDDDGLTKSWDGTVFLNPPFASKLITKFVGKLIAELDAGNTTAAVLLTNNETDASWFQVAAARADAICFPAGRLKFLRPDGVPSKSGALQGQTFFFYGRDITRFTEVFGKLGLVVAPVGAALEV